jgi:hypothetical protein
VPRKKRLTLLDVWLGWAPNEVRYGTEESRKRVKFRDIIKAVEADGWRMVAQEGSPRVWDARVVGLCYDSPWAFRYYERA